MQEADWSDNPLERLCDRMEAMATVCALDGSVYGGACDLALACDFRIGVIFHESGLRRFIERLVPQVAWRLFLASEIMESDELHRIGFLDRVVMSPLAARGASFTIRQGRTLALVGESGYGKHSRAS